MPSGYISDEYDPPPDDSKPTRAEAEADARLDAKCDHPGYAWDFKHWWEDTFGKEHRIECDCECSDCRAF